MNISFQRKIDYWVGVPLCLFLSGLNRCRLFTKKKPAETRKIVFIKLSELGAIIQSYPFLVRIKERFPKSELFFVTFRKNKDVFDYLCGIIPEKNVLTIRDDTFFHLIGDTLRALKILRREKIDLVFDLEFFARFSAILGYLIQPKKASGFFPYTFEGLYRGNFLTHRHLYNPLNHICRNYLSLADAIDDPDKKTPEFRALLREEKIIFPQYTGDPSFRQALRHKLSALGIESAAGRRTLLLNAGEEVLPLREWPLENFIKLANSILQDENNYLILIGTEGAEKKAGLIRQALATPRCANIVGQTSLSELMELFLSSDLLISNDCGLAHLAMLTQIKKIVIFGPESPQVFAPLDNNTCIVYSDMPCSPCLSAFNHRLSVCADNLCLKAINPQEVFGLVQRYLIKR